MEVDMIKVIENNAIQRCRCQYCNSILEYSVKDKHLVQVGPRKDEYQIYCQACNRYTRFDIPE